ncbi:XRE family transcriptional regulator [Streptomyces inhibens]|uniref:XRE family transcriptional regulator n=2 Tax=Streptomyces inhibens TaxID=2293571 RepID=A0A371PPU8_STRIH|nr:XRE family transcriptional regulator [Streptomyces inhibens]
MPVETPFGARLKALRQKRGLSQAALAGNDISTGYLSRLESGARQPTERVITYLAGRLGVDRSALFSPYTSSSLSEAVSVAVSTDSDDAVEAVVTALASAQGDDPLVRWQALWLVAQFRRRRGEHAEERTSLEEAIRIADGLALTALQCRSRTELARCLRATGDVTEALELAVAAYELARESGVSVSDTSKALLTLVSAEAEAGRLPDARAHVDELVALVANHSDALRTEALWAAATVRSRQGDDDGALAFIQQAMDSLDSRVDLVLWARLRLAAASLYLQARPTLTKPAHACLAEAERALSLVGTPVQQQELLTLQARLAFADGHVAGARDVLDRLDFERLALSYRDRVQLQLLESLLLIEEGHREQGLSRLKRLGEEAHRDSNMNLAAQVWRVLAEALEQSP